MHTGAFPVRRDWKRRLRYVTGVTSKSLNENVGSTVITQKISPSVQNGWDHLSHSQWQEWVLGLELLLLLWCTLIPSLLAFAANITSKNSSAGLYVLFFWKYITCRSLWGSWPEQLALEIPPIFAEILATVSFGPLELLSLLMSSFVLGHVGEKRLSSFMTFYLRSEIDRHVIWNQAQVMRIICSIYMLE